MGLIKALTGAVGGVLSDQWRDYFYCDSLDTRILVTKGRKRAGKRSSNTKGTENIISNGSVIAVANGQCMIIVDQGKVAEICAEPGEFVYDTSTEPSIFFGNLNDTIVDTFKSIGKRFSFGGEPPKDQRVYFINTKEITGNKYGTPSPVPFRVVDPECGINFPVNIRCNGEFSYRVTNPILFYTNVCGNVQSEYERSQIDSMLKTEILTALQPAFAEISQKRIAYDALYLHTVEITEALNRALSEKWGKSRGLEVVSFGINSATPSEKDVAKLQQLYESSMYRNPGMAAGALVGAQAEAMKSAASNPGGAMTGFMGMGFAQQSGGMNTQNLFQMQQQPSNPPSSTSTEQGWKCGQCGHSGNSGKFCSECAAPKPAADTSWACPKCGHNGNAGKFCSECAAPKTAANTSWACPKCGHPENTGKFCAECAAPKPV